MADIDIKIVDGQLHCRFDQDGKSFTCRMNDGEARSLFLGLAAQIPQMAAATPVTDLIRGNAMIDVFSPSFQVGEDDDGNAILGIQIEPMPPMRFRFPPDHTRAIIDGLVTVMLGENRKPHTIQ